jgi:hypothetical protein
MPRPLPALATLALLAACHPSSSGNGAAAANASTGVDPIEAKIVAFPEPLRQTTFLRAIRDANFDCQEVVKEESRPRDAGRAVWVVACDHGQQYVLALDRGGIFEVSGVPPQPKTGL